MPQETIDELRSLGDRLIAVRGNADREVVEVFDGRAGDDLPPDSLWGGQQITRDQRDWLAALPLTITLESERLGTVLFCHATPRDDSEVVVETTSDDELRTKLGDVDADVIVCGNTHMQFDRHVDRYRVVNVGSVGMPYGQTGAFWALLDQDVEFVRTEYDLASAAQTIRRYSDWDMADAFAEENVLSVPSKEEALAFFESLP
jgi:predicted phosphodiesterase